MNVTKIARPNLRTAAGLLRYLALLAISFSATVLALAQPRIITQPRNVAVLPDQNAQFRVTASGAGPLAYQWRFNGIPLEGAITNSLALSNIALAQLGGYDVLVSNSTGSVTSAPAWLLFATRWTELVFFGASEGLQMCATGPPWNDQLANRLGVPLRNYAVAGATSSGVHSQIAGYLLSHTPTTNVLVSLWVGGSEDSLTGSPERAASNRLEHVRTLAVAGARNFLIPHIGPLPPGLHAQLPNLSEEVALQYDALLDVGLDLLKAEYALTVFRPDIFAFLKRILDNPTTYGFSDPPGADFWCDGFHMSFAVQRLVSQECYRSLTPPLWVTLQPQGASDLLALQWQGGSAPFRVQHCDDLTAGVWQSEEVTFESNATVARSAPQQLFRILFLGQ
jgi:hypothetical protein